jgi:hypothetical protein
MQSIGGEQHVTKNRGTFETNIRPTPAAKRNRSRSRKESSTPQSLSSGELIEKAINGGNPAVPGDDEISPGVRWRMTRATRPARHCPTPQAGRLADIGSQDDWP